MANPAQFDYIGDKGVMGLFFQAYDQALNKTWASQIANVIPSNTAVEQYAGIGNAPALREWVGGKMAKSLAEYNMTVANKDFEATLAVKRKDLTRDKTGQLQIKIANLADRAAEHWDKLLSALIDTGDDADLGLAYDGQYFFDDDHVIGDSGTMDNDIAAPTVVSTSAVTSAEAAAIVLKMIQTAYGLKDDQGEPVNQAARDWMLMVPPAQYGPFATALTKDFITSGVQNPLLGLGHRIVPVVNPRLTSDVKVYLFRTDSPQKPFLIQQETAPIMEVLGEGSDHAFLEAEHLFSVRKSGNVAFWDFTKAVMMTVTAA